MTCKLISYNQRSKEKAGKKINKKIARNAQKERDKNKSKTVFFGIKQKIKKKKQIALNYYLFKSKSCNFHITFLCVNKNKRHLELTLLTGSFHFKLLRLSKL